MDANDTSNNAGNHSLQSMRPIPLDPFSIDALSYEDLLENRHFREMVRKRHVVADQFLESQSNYNKLMGLVQKASEQRLRAVEDELRKISSENQVLKQENRFHQQEVSRLQTALDERTNSAVSTIYPSDSASHFALITAHNPTKATRQAHDCAPELQTPEGHTCITELTATNHRITETMSTNLTPAPDCEGLWKCALLEMMAKRLAKLDESILDACLVWVNEMAEVARNFRDMRDMYNVPPDPEVEWYFNHRVSNRRRDGRDTISASEWAAAQI
ncbi:hypothetical protein SERLA73DRAFT_161408 [Serpula lacrymans var. lacrymans S7.3]|uniref:Uncharacterized protein n=1 Tax=Serpula lacrymans var. lacrymans (strain S7.3) TaxID=936435 RepID=F8Q294_SERL3|nr:hypothetical protein SERLA73DRAFT_161408 [Serpula lacrymans var. lacrymans S7.3]